jgi:hypothetical protein
MTESEMYWVVSKFVPRLLTQNHRDIRVDICQELLNHVSENENFLKRIITGDETWVYGYDVEMKMQSPPMGWKKFTKTERVVAGQVECESHVDGFFDTESVVHHKFLHQGQRVNCSYYLSAEISKSKCQEKKTSVMEKQLLVHPS